MAVKAYTSLNILFQPCFFFFDEGRNYTCLVAAVMGLNYEEALAYSLNLIEQVKNTGGELTLLWHNTSAQENTDSYLRKLYSHLLNELAKK